MMEGFWILQVQGPQGSTGGVAVFVNGKIFGGDNGFLYMGTYMMQGGIAKARIIVQNFDSAVPNIMGLTGNYEMHISATITGDKGVGTAMVANQPQRTVGIQLTKKADL